ncbi:MAG TPA: DUF2127 domain-containing protein [Acidobacteriaceae bacterium]|jgi:uncharacterized membrane protein (DUF2068 family)|nr:DUF2127 domain-containing protein [Acidobacteriaceae bacterium]
MSEEDRSRPLPGVAAIGLYMFLLCVLWLVPISRGQMPKVMLILCAAFAVGGQGLLRQKRWGWAMSLAAIFLSGIQEMWRVAEYHDLLMLAGAAFNMILFLYLVRPEVRQRMK